MRFRIRKGVAVFVAALLFVLSFTAPSFATVDIAGEIAEQHQVNGAAGDVFDEKQQETALSPLAFIMMGVYGVGVGTPLATAAKGKVFNLVLKQGTLSTALGLTFLSNGGVAKWENWPSGRFRFHSVQPEASILRPGGYLARLNVMFEDFVANQIFSLSRALVILGNGILFLAFNTGWTSDVGYWLSEHTKDLFDFREGTLANLFLLLALCGLGVMLAFYFLQFQITRMIVAILCAVLVVALLLGYSAICGPAVHAAVRFSDEVAGLSLSTLAKVFSLETSPTAQIPNPLNEGLCTSANAVWEVAIVYPWKYGMFGATPLENLVMTKDEWEKFQECIDPRYAETVTEHRQWGNRQVTCIFRGKNSLAESAGRNLRIDTLYLAVVNDFEMRSELLKALSDPEVDHGKHKELARLLSPEADRGMHHLWVAFTTVLPALGFAVLAIFLGGMMLISQIIAVVLLIFLPLVALVALVPDTGWSFALGYLKQLAGFFLFKIIVGLYLGAVLGVATLVVKPLLS